MLGRRHSQDPADPSSDESSGSIPHLLKGFQDYFAARTELLGIESAEAARYAKQQALLGIILAVTAFFAYALILVALVPLLGLAISALLPESLNSYGWPFSALFLAGVHILVIIRITKKLSRPPEQTLFEVTRAEFQKDRQWIKDQQDKNESSS